MFGIEIFHFSTEPYFGKQRLSVTETTSHIQSILQILCKSVCHIKTGCCAGFFCKLTDDLRLCLSCSGVGDRDSASMLGGVVLLSSPVVTLSVPC